MANMTKWILCTLLLLAGCHAGDPQSVSVSGESHSRAQVAADSTDSAYVGVVQQLYVGYFGRPADPAGLAFYTHAYHLAGAPTTLAGLAAAYPGNSSVQALVDSFSASQEAQALYPSSSYVGDDFTFIYAVYNNLFSRDPDIAGAEFWSWKLNGHAITRGSAVLSIMAGAQGTDADLVSHKADVAVQFTGLLDTPERVAAYDGYVSNAVVRAMLQNVPSAADQAARQALASATVDTLLMAKSGSVVEEKALPRRIALVATAGQLAANQTLLKTLAGVLAADLGGLRPLVPVSTVDVLPAATTVSGMRELLKPYDGAILIGNVPMPTLNVVGTLTPELDVYRTPRCPFEFKAGSDEVIGTPFLLVANPDCRNGLMVSVLRGASAATELQDVASKLEQMIAYHRASQAKNEGWDKRYQNVRAGWFGGIEFPDVSQVWGGLSMYASDKIAYLLTGSGEERMKAFLACISSNTEMCVFNGHGNQGILDFEGPGIPDQFYSTDSRFVGWATLVANRPKAKFISLVSCSTQDFFSDNSIGTELLIGGDSLLTYGFTAETLVSSEYEQKNISTRFAVLSLGGTTFADAYHDMTAPENFQGDPFISMRPFPTGDRPLMVVNGKHYNEVNTILPLELPDSVNGMKSTRVLHIRNGGSKDLHLKTSAIPGAGDTGAGYGAGGGQIEYGYNAAFKLERNVAVSSTGVMQVLGDVQITLKPGEQVALTYSLIPLLDASNQPLRRDIYTTQFIITSDDPTLARLAVEASGRVR